MQAFARKAAHQPLGLFLGIGIKRLPDVMTVPGAKLLAFSLAAAVAGAGSTALGLAVAASPGIATSGAGAGSGAAASAAGGLAAA